MSSHGAHLGIRDKIKIYAMPKAICNRPFYFTRKIGFGLSTFYTHFHKWLTFNIVTEALARHDQANFCISILQLEYYLYVINAKFYYFRNITYHLTWKFYQNHLLNNQRNRPLKTKSSFHLHFWYAIFSLHFHTRYNGKYFYK